MKNVIRNKNKYVIMCFIIICCMLIGTMPATFADTAGPTIKIDDVVINNDTQQITVTGNISPAASRQRVTLRILKPNLNPDSSIVLNNQGNDMLDIFNYIYQVNTDANGAFRFTYAIKSGTPSGTYKVLIGGTGISVQAIKDFNYYNPVEVRQTFDILNATTDPLSLKNALLSGFNSEMLRLDFTYYNGLNDSDKQKVFADVYNIKTNIIQNKKTSGFDSTGHLNDAFTQASLVQSINEKDAATIRSWFDNAVTRSLLQSIICEKSQSGYQIYLNVYSIYNNNALLNEDGKNAVFTDMANSDYECAGDLWKKFNERVFAQAIYRVYSYKDIPNILDTEASRTILSSEDETPTTFNYTKYDSLSKKENVWKKIANVLYADYDAFGDAFNNAVDDEYDNEHGTHVSSPSGGGSSSGKTTVSVNTEVPVVTPIPIETPDFVDVGNVPWAVDSIRALASKGIVNGYEDGTFKPNDEVTREQFIKLLVLAFYNVDETAVCSFGDVSPNDWYAGYVATAQKLGLSDGIGNNLFGVGQKISRQEMVTMAYRAMVNNGYQLQDNSGALNFSDAGDVAEYAIKPVVAMQNSGVISGSDGNRFNPNETSTRAEASKVIYQLMKLAQKAD